MTPVPKPAKTLRQLKARKDRHEAAVKTSVRQECVERDGFCALDGYQHRLGPCQGVSEWAHHHSRRRSKTMRMAAGHRHSSAFSFMACSRHHRAYDAHKFLVVLSDFERGMNGRWALVWRLDAADETRH